MVISSLGSELKHHILTLTLNRPERGNSLDPPTLVELRQKILDAQTNDNIRLILLTASGEKDFCTGIDIDSVKELPAEQKTNTANVAGDIASLLYFGKPSMVVINGRAMGMGVVFAVAADYRICVDSASFRMPELNVGIFPGASCIALMTRICGIAATRKMLLIAEPFSPKDAVQSNIIDEVLTRTSIQERITIVSKSLVQKHPLLVRCVKSSITHERVLSYKDTIKMETEFADYYAWKDPKAKFADLENRYGVEYSLTGDPDQLLTAYNKPPLK